MFLVARKGSIYPAVMEAMRQLKMERDGNQIETTDLSPEMVAEVPQLALIGGFRKYMT